MSNRLLVDTGYWIALFDIRDQYHDESVQREEYLEMAALIVPWPILYETLRTRFVRKSEWIRQLEKLLKRPEVAFVDDEPYREDAYALAVESSTQLQRPISMVDMLCRLLIEDSNNRINYLLTNNPADFEDVCRKRGVTIL